MGLLRAPRGRRGRARVILRGARRPEALRRLLRARRREPRRRRRRVRLDHRPQRRGQVDADQRADRRAARRRAARCASRTATSAGIGPVALARARHGAQLPARARSSPTSPCSRRCRPRSSRGSAGGTRLFASLAGDRAGAGRARSRWPSCSGSPTSATRPRARCPRATRSCSTWPPPSRCGPEIILLDEPTSGVSTADKTAIMEILVTASRRIGRQGHHPGRARHGHRLRLLRPHRRPAPGQGPGRRHARRDPRRRAAWWTPSSAAPRPVGPRAATVMLAVRELDVFIQASHILRRVSLEVGDARGGLPGRSQRRGQDHHAAHDHGLPAARAPAPSTFKGEPIHGPPHPRDRASAASASRPRTAGSSPTSPWPRTSRSPPGRGRAAGRRPSAIELAYEVFPRAARATPTARGPQMSGRRAQDALDRPRARAGPRDAAARRAVRGPVARHHPGGRRRRSRAITRLGRAILIAESNIHHVPAFDARAST